MIRKLILATILLSAALGFSQEKRAMDTAIDPAFGIFDDGRVMVDGELFNSMRDYHNSDKFRYEGRRCRSVEAMLKAGRNPKAALAPSDCDNSQTVIQPEYYINDTITIPVVFHILMDSNGNGDIDDSLITSQVDILNEDFGAFSGTPGAPGYDSRIRFELAGITRTVNNQWFNDRRESQYKSSTGWDRDTYLNIWTNTASGYLGYAYYPDGSAGSTVDGVVLNYTAVGRDAPNGGIYNQGRTATHEVGHYLGLPHTFDGGCGQPNQPYTTGDLIADTNPESTSQFDCEERVTCNTPDPIHNYMDYTPDACMDNFTQEQSNRMVCSILNYRPNLGGGGDPPGGDFSLTVSAYKVRGTQHADLSWSGATGSNVDIYRDGALIATTANNGSYTDNIGAKGGGSYTYSVCESGSNTCSNDANASF